jgi:plastocyanin
MPGMEHALRGLRVLAVCLAPIVVLLVVGLAGRDDPVGARADASRSAHPSAVTVRGFAFSPATLTVPAGTTVEWTNRDGFDHSIVDRADRFRGRPFRGDTTFAHKYEKPGKYPYFCGIHNSMTGTVVVTG